MYIHTNTVQTCRKNADVQWQWWMARGIRSRYSHLWEKTPLGNQPTSSACKQISACYSQYIYTVNIYTTQVYVEERSTVYWIASIGIRTDFCTQKNKFHHFNRTRFSKKIPNKFQWVALILSFIIKFSYW